MIEYRSATPLLLAIIVASALAFLRMEQLKLQHSPVGSPHVGATLSPGCTDPGCTAVARMHFTLRDAQRLHLAIVRTNGDVLRQLADRPFAKGRVSVRWDGRDDSGAIAADGSYRLRVTLESGREVTIPDPIVVDTKPPPVTLGKVTIGSVVVAVHYTRPTSVHAELNVFQGSRLVLHKRRVKPRVAHFRLDAVAPGPTTIEIVAVDRAGNRTPNPPSVTVQLP